MGLKKRIWKPRVDEKEHIVELTHGYWSGRREIRVDGKLVHQGRRLFDIGSQHTFSICEYECTLRISSGLFGFRYGLRVNGQLVLPFQEYYDCERVDWLFSPRTFGDYLAQASYVLGRIVCVILAVQVLLLFGSPILGAYAGMLGIAMLHFVAVYSVPALVCIPMGIVALFLPSAQVQARRARALRGIGLGVFMLVWLVFVWVWIAPEIEQAF